MNNIIIKSPHLCTRMEVWTPRYHDQYQTGEPVALLHVGKVNQSSPTIIVEFTKAKHLAGQRFAIKREYAQQHPVGTNGKAPMYIIPMSHFSSWQSSADILKTIDEIWPN